MHRLLFDLSDLASDEAQRYLFTLNDIVACIGDVETWAVNRKRLRDAAAKLTSDETVVVRGITTARSATLSHILVGNCRKRRPSTR